MWTWKTTPAPVAAEILRERAAEATPGPWQWRPDIDDGLQSESGDEVVGAYGQNTEGWVSVDPGDAEWIAMMSPELAPMMAVILENAAVFYEQRWTDYACLDLARAIVEKEDG